MRHILDEAAVPTNRPPGFLYDGTARGLREHSFHIGNDRATLIGSNYGTWRLRQVLRGD